jgi:hypothetical protein
VQHVWIQPTNVYNAPKVGRNTVGSVSEIRQLVSGWGYRFQLCWNKQTLIIILEILMIPRTTILILLRPILILLRPIIIIILATIVR